MAIDQNARLGLPTAKASCTSKPYTTTDFPLGTGPAGLGEHVPGHNQAE